MKVMFPNSAWVAARERFLIRAGGWGKVRLKVRYGVVIHPTIGPILIDTGYSAHALHHKGRSAPLRLYAKVLRPQMNPAQQPIPVLARLGFASEDVTTIIVTHFHADHACALKDFPNARFVVDGAAWAQVRRAPKLRNLAHGVFTELLPQDFGARVVPLHDCAQTGDGADIFGDGSLIAVPLPGHAKGHFGVLIAHDPAPIFYAVDTQWLRAGVVENRPTGFPARLTMDDYQAFKTSSRAVADRIAQGTDVVFCHDPQDGAHDWAG